MTGAAIPRVFAERDRPRLEILAKCLEGTPAMDWKYKHFKKDMIFKADRESVKIAFESFSDDWLGDWKVSETGDGFEADGASGGHGAIAKFRIEEVPDGTRLSIELLIVRNNIIGYALWDVFGYYDGELRKWLTAISWWIEHPKRIDMQPAGKPGQIPPAARPLPKPSPALNCLWGCAFIGMTFAVLIYTVFALAGLVTGTLTLPGNEGDLIIHKPWGRIVAGAILLLLGGLVSWSLTWKYRKQRPGNKNP